eukprot:CAMPEP_0183295066 /NCGR_PEP_ID=MMETSP0160_2-20130417/3164_1 /TAXON_ID=2839 ORGANISM="Odontella Sinensis, Strain Grunow 1884" /NCGR_SAMPLE_ID=MMETSP0160_2 /ASSEMBLY_ACC=CAM_ASM_000250 /LENGTH=175 /DNA_ID=CAMNT_0025456483 /DNA_START=55 /DNA_END=578 /DNA_ORIENTATION=+
MTTTVAFVAAAISLISPQLSSAYTHPSFVPNVAHRRDFLASFSAAAATLLVSTESAAADDDDDDGASSLPPGFRPVQRRYVAALGDPKSTRGDNSDEWGLWTLDPGPRGSPPSDLRRLEAEGRGPYGWAYDPSDFWIEEHGIVMESPDFPLSVGRYFVTGERRGAAAILTVEEGG